MLWWWNTQRGGDGGRLWQPTSGAGVYSSQGRSCAGMRLGAVAVAVAGGCRFTCRSATEATQSSSSTTSLPPDAATLPNEAMTAQILSGELANLVNESKRKNPDLRSVCDHTFPSYPFPADSSLLRRQTSHCRTSNLCHPHRRPS